jgi:mycofactocin system glycosyltransferase
VVAFVDADCRAAPGWLGPLVDHLADPDVGAVAPRIRARAGAATAAWLAAYEAVRSPLDLGTRPGAVRPRSRVPYVPATVLVVRRSALAEVGGFDATLRYGEDVDLVWRLVAAGWVVRYEPASTVSHGVRRSLVALARQRFDYGTSAAPLARRHGEAVAPLSLSPWSGAAWVAVVLGHPLAGVAAAAASTAALAPRLRPLEHPWREAARLAGLGHLRSGRLAADAARRTWWPLLVAACALSGRARRVALALALVPPLLERRPPREIVHVPAWLGLRLLDDMAYGLGVWAGAARARSPAALRPHVSGRSSSPSSWRARRAGRRR